MTNRYGWYAAYFPGEFSPSWGRFADSKGDYRAQLRADGMRLPRGSRVERMGDS